MIDTTKKINLIQGDCLKVMKEIERNHGLEAHTCLFKCDKENNNGN